MGHPQSRRDILTSREQRILDLVVCGATNREIARALGLSANTVDNAMVRIKHALGIARRGGVIAWWYGDTVYGQTLAPVQLRTGRTPSWMARRLTTRQREVLEYVVRGATDGEVAAELGIRVETAENHARGIMRRLGAQTRYELAVLYYGGRLYRQEGHVWPT